MTDDRLPEVGPWAADKLERLRKYLSAYAAILSKQDWCDGYIFVDAFAGAGRAVVRRPDDSASTNAEFAFGETDEEPDDEFEHVLDGSPAVALGVSPPFTRYVFLEKRPDRVKRLESLCGEHRDRSISIQQGDSNEYLCDDFLRGFNWRRWRAVVFLDPFGMQVPWATLKALAGTKAIEVFINFPVNMAIQRLLKKSGKFTDKERRKLDAYFGDSGWYELLYSSNPSLFGPQLRKVPDSGQRLVAWYRDRLKAEFGFASNAYLVNATNGHPLYYLIFAGPKDTGAKIANHVLSAGTRVPAAGGRKGSRRP